MSLITDFMSQDHRACDGGYVDAEAAVQRQEWPAAGTAWQRFAASMRTHFGREEDVLFPAFEQATGMRGGPTMMMRMEHEQMRALLAQLDDAVRAQDRARFLALGETLMVLMQQHNMKEEQILYPMCDQHLPDAAAMRGRLQAQKEGSR